MAKFRVTKQIWKDKKQDIAILLVVAMNGKTHYISTGFRVPSNDWNDETKEVRKTHPLYKEINSRIKGMLLTCQQTEIKLLAQNISPTFEHYKQALYPEQAKTHQETFTEYFSRKIDGRRVSSGSKKTYHNTLRLFKEFKNPVSFKELTYTLLNNFDDYLRTQGFKNNTLGKHHTILRTFINEAIKEDLLEKNPYKKGFKILKEQGKRIALTIAEVSRLENLTFEGDAQYLDKYRDAYLFCCYTGLRYSDMANLNRKQFTITGEVMSLEIATQKSKRAVYLPLHTLYEGKPKKIILKYWSLELPNIFPKMSNQKFNAYLKEIAKLANIEKHLTHHVARHTFGTIGASLMSFGTLKELMAHSKPETTAIYVKMTNEHIDNALNKVNWK